MEIIKAEEGEILDIELEEDFLKKNRELAQKNRLLLDQRNITCIDIMGSIGSGKTSLIKGITSSLHPKYHVAVIAGDLTTDIDANRIRQENVEVVQVNTGKECHLDANLVKKALESLPLEKVNLILIENVGNLICPAEFPLGAHQRLVVVSVTEGPWMVVKHPYIFEDANVVAINKIDLAEAMEVSPQKLIEDVARINPRIKAFPVSCRQNRGILQIIEALHL